MITYNGIKLDYYGKSINKLIVKKGLTDIETLLNRKGTRSTRFDIPRTAVNEKAFEFISTEGVISKSTGEAILYIDGNVYDKGNLYVVGYTDEYFQCNYFGKDVDVIKSIKELKLREVIKESSSDLFNNSYWSYTDFFIKSALNTVVSTQLDFHIGHPQNMSPLSAETCSPFFKASDIFKKILTDQGLTVESDFLTKKYTENVFYSNYTGKHISANTLLSATTTYTSLSGELNIGAISVGTSVTKAGNKYSLTNSAELVKIQMNINVPDTAEVARTNLRFRIVRPTGTQEIYRSNFTLLQVGNNKIDASITRTLLSGDYIIAEVLINLKDGSSLPISHALTVSDGIIKNDNIQDSNIIMLSDYLGTGTQLEFLQNFLKHHNLVMDIQGETAFIEVQDSGTMHVGTDDITLELETTTGIAIENEDITTQIQRIQDVTFDYDLKDSIYFEQGMLSNSNLADTEIKEYGAFGSRLYQLNGYGSEVEPYKTGFNSCYDNLDNFQAVSDTIQPMDFLTSWSEFISCRSKFLGDFGDTETVDYTNSDASTTTTTIFSYTNQNTRIDFISRYLFKNTINQRVDKKIKEIFIYDHLGTLITFRKNYIIDYQVYKLISYEYEPISKMVIAQIIAK